MRMGNESFKDSSPERSESRLSRLKQRLRIHRHGRRHRFCLGHSRTDNGSGSSSHHKVSEADHFSGIALLTLTRVCVFIYIYIIFIVIVFIIQCFIGLFRYYS